jgi:predicted transcriptional regulator
MLGEKTHIRATGVNKRMAGDSGDMTREERVDIVLEFLARHELALTTKAIYRNLKVNNRFTVGQETLRLYLNDLVDRGLVQRVDPEAMEEMEITELTADDRRGYYMITEKGREEIEIG